MVGIIRAVPNPKQTPAPPARSRKKPLLIGTGIAGLVALAGVLVLNLTSGDDNKPPEPTVSPLAFAEDAGVPYAQAGCEDAETPSYQGHQEVMPGDEHPPYSSKPPTSGWYLIVRPQAGFYRIPLPVERIMNIPANGGVAIWTSEAEAFEVQRFMIKAGRDDVIANVWSDEVPTGVVFTAWGVMQRCEKFSGQAASAFLATYGTGKALKEREPDYVPGSRPTSLPKENTQSPS